MPFEARQKPLRAGWNADADALDALVDSTPRIEKMPKDSHRFITAYARFKLHGATSIFTPKPLPTLDKVRTILLTAGKKITRVTKISPQDPTQAENPAPAGLLLRKGRRARNKAGKFLLPAATQTLPRLPVGALPARGSPTCSAHHSPPAAVRILATSKHPSMWPSTCLTFSSARRTHTSPGALTPPSSGR